LSSLYFRFSGLKSTEQRSALLERLLARADATVAASDWRAEAFRIIAPPAAAMPSIAATALYADRGAVDAAWVCLATPVGYLAEMTRVRLPADGMLSLTASAAEALAADFNRVWQGAGIRLTAAKSAQLFCLFDRPLDVTTRDPRELLGQPIEEYLPSGEDAARLRLLISETEMWLFEHGVNGTRADAGLPVVNGLWFWGGGTALAELPKVDGWVGGDDVFFNAFGAREEAGTGSGVVVAGVPGSDRWQDTELRWLQPAIGQLRAGRLSKLEMSAENSRFTLTARGLRRIWRRSRPWWEFLA
jgi:hypothetical protein